MSEHEDRLLSINPDPIRLVDRGVREVWTKQPGWRCYHEDGRGRCTSRGTRAHSTSDPKVFEWYCERHADAGTVAQDVGAMREP